MKLAISLSILFICLQGCTAASFYEGARQNRLNECRKLQGTPYEECMQQYKDDYRAYIKKREAARDGR